MVNLLVTVFASVILVIGLISMVTPVPVGTFMISVSLTMLICSSPRAQRCIKFFRERASWFNKMFDWLEAKVGTRISFVGKALKQTRPTRAELTP